MTFRESGTLKLNGIGELNGRSKEKNIKVPT
jgi:hypothetical protein